MRRFIRHPADIPITLHPLRDSRAASIMKDISLGGIACLVDHKMPVGREVLVDIQSVEPEYHGRGKIVWCRECGTQYEVGISFCDQNEAFKSRMVQQICQIEQYKQTVFEKEGRQLDSNQAAAEWIERYAADFARDL